MTAPSELDAIRARYARRAAISANRYSRFNPEVLARVHERQRATMSLLAAKGIRSLDGLDVMEVGSGTGGNLIEFLELGVAPERLVGNDLLIERIEQARRVLPESVRLYPGDAAALPFGEATFDIVYQSTVFSSILDDPLQASIAAAMWRWVRPGGGVLWYDFIVDNPSNRDVRGVPLKRVRALFPQASISARRITLAPPIGRRICHIHPAAYGVFNLLPFLRTHALCWIQKP